MEKIELNVHFSANLIDKKIVEFLSQQFKLNLIEIKLEEIRNSRLNLNDKIKNIDLIIFTGGEDVNPEYYGQNLGKFTHVNQERDSLEFALLYSENISSSILHKIPKLGICRGAQLLTVYNGGSLIQHTNGHNNDLQLIEYNIEGKGGVTKISSDHHQMMYPFNLRISDYQLLGWSKNFQSNTYLNGNNEECSLDSNFLEPEIIYYPCKNSLCIQAHPEWCIGSEGSDFCLKLIKKYLLKKLPEGLPLKGNFFGELAFCSKEELYVYDGLDWIKKITDTKIKSPNLDDFENFESYYKNAFVKQPINPTTFINISPTEIDDNHLIEMKEVVYNLKSK